MAITSKMHVTLEATIQREAPDTTGVYALYNKAKVLTYYGKSDLSIRENLLSHLSGKEGKCTQDAWYFNFEETGKQVAREKELLEECRKGNKAMPKCMITVL